MMGITNSEHAAPTLEDVALVAGVSRATVSRVVNGGTRVAPETIDTVRKAISELHYHPNRAARALVTRRTGAIAVLVPEGDERVFSDPFFPQAYHGALQGFGGSDVQVVLVMAQPGDSAQRMVRYLESGHVDGAIIVSHHGPTLARALANTPQPVVFIGDPQSAGMYYVDVDQVTAARTATEHLIARGARRIGTITGPMDMAAAIQRLRGFEEAMTAAGLDASLRADGDFTTIGGSAAAERLLAMQPGLDGLFVANDLMAAGAMRFVEDAGRRVPEDVMVVGFDDSAVALQTVPTLTTMTNPASELARIAAEMLSEILAGHSPQSPVMLASRLILRQST